MNSDKRELSGQLYTRSKLNTKLGNYTRGQNSIRNWATMQEVKTKYEAGQLYTRSKQNTKLGNYTRVQN